MNSQLDIALALVLAAGSAGLVGCGAEEGPASHNEDLTAAGADVPRKDGGQFEILRTKSGYQWRLLAETGDVILTGTPRQAHDDAVDDITRAAHIGEIDEAYVFVATDANVDEADDGEWYFLLIGMNAQTIGTSGVFASKSGMVHGMETVMSFVGQALIDDWTNVCGHQLVDVGGPVVPTIAYRDGYMGTLEPDPDEATAKARIERALTVGGELTSYWVAEQEGGKFYIDLEDEAGDVVLTSQYVASEADAWARVADLVAVYNQNLGCVVQR
jgi:uncharacterized protein YegP (UPF0339 family)